ncbi:MAG: hypothetical protein N3C12_07910 [Candidatus Binatia bacterium]|nr:hypothetical protein [Candidatus Binatia bacterium]
MVVWTKVGMDKRFAPLARSQSRLTELERIVLQLRYRVTGRVLSYSAIARRLGLTAWDVRHLERVALKRLRHAFRNDPLVWDEA